MQDSTQAKMSDKLTLRPPTASGSGNLTGSLESRFDTDDDDEFSRVDFFGGVRRGIKKLGSISGASHRPAHLQLYNHSSDRDRDRSVTPGERSGRPQLVKTPSFEFPRRGQRERERERQGSGAGLGVGIGSAGIGGGFAAGLRHERSPSELTREKPLPRTPLSPAFEAPYEEGEQFVLPPPPLQPQLHKQHSQDWLIEEHARRVDEVTPWETHTAYERIERQQIHIDRQQIHKQHSQDWLIEGRAREQPQQQIQRQQSQDWLIEESERERKEEAVREIYRVPVVMSKHNASGSRTSTMDSTSSNPMFGAGYTPGSNTHLANMVAGQNVGGQERRSPAIGQEEDPRDREVMTPKSNGPPSAGPSPAQNRTAPPSGGSAQHLSGLMCNVHRTTGREPHPLVGATTTILGDKLYVFGGRILSRTRPALTSDLYELDLIHRHWSKIEAFGEIPPPRYFHSVCPLGDTKLVCYGGMSPAPSAGQMQAVASTTGNAQEPQSEVVVMSDIHIYDAPSRTWSYIPTQETPQGRYAHCATILPSSATFSSTNAASSAIQHNLPGSNPNQGTLGVNIDGTGGAEMVVVGGQDSANHYIEQISVFNLRSLKWTMTQQLGKSCGAYRSVVVPLSSAISTRIGRNSPTRPEHNKGPDSREPGSSALIYSNYNFLDVKLELQIRSSDGTLSEKPMQGIFTPPGLRFPNGGVIDTNFVVSGTYLTSSKQEYALWALDLRTLTWSRIDAGGSVFSQGSWNRGVLWNRRNTFVILGNRKRSLVEDYNHRRINFSNVCMVELEAFGLYDNPRKASPMSGFVSASSPFTAPSLSLGVKAGWTAGGRSLSRAAEELGSAMLGLKEMADMDIICAGGERIPVNSRILARRWGPYFVQLLREGAATQDGNDAATLRPDNVFRHNPSRNSSVTITPSLGAQSTGMSTSSTLINNNNTSLMTSNRPQSQIDATTFSQPPDASTLAPTSRPRTLY